MQINIDIERMSTSHSNPLSLLAKDVEMCEENDCCAPNIFGILSLTLDLVLKVYLDPKERNSTEYKLDTFGGVYKRLTGREVNFEFPQSETS